MENVIAKQTGRAVLATILVVASSAALNAAGTSTAQFLKLGAGARAAGMADAFTSNTDDVTSAYWNPAGLAAVEAVQVSAMHNSWLQETDYQYIGTAMPVRGNVFALSLYRMDYGSIDKYTAADAREGSFDAADQAVAFSFGRNWSENLSLGVSGTYIQQSIEAEKASGFSGDIGAIYKWNKAKFGASIKHLGAGMKMVEESDPLPLTVRVGASTRFFNDHMDLAFDISKPNDNDATLHFGSEYRVAPQVTLRGGYKLTPGNNLDVDGLTNLTGGLGFNLSRFSIDYAISPFGDLGTSHRVSFTFRFHKN